jgi:deoxyribodipyrimidine photo-lyase
MTGRAEAVWLTAESMGDADPALAAHGDLPVVFVFDEPLLDRLRLSSKRLVFLVETLADLAGRRTVEVWLGAPVEVLAGRPLAVTFTPVPGWRVLSSILELAAVHPWPWLVRPGVEIVDSRARWKAVLDA